MFYYAVLIIGQNEMGPANHNEMAYFMFTLIGACFFNALVFSDLAVMVQKIMKNETKYQAKIDDANAVMESIGLSSDVREDIHEFLSMTYDTQEFQSIQNNFILMICPSLQIKVYRKIFEAILMKNTLIQQYLKDKDDHEKQSEFLMCFSSCFKKSKKTETEAKSKVNRKLSRTESKSLNNTVKIIGDKIIREPEDNNNFFLLHLIEKLGS